MVASEEVSREVESKMAIERKKRPWWVRLLILFGVLYVSVLILLLIFEPWLVYPGTLFPLDPSWNEASFEYEEIEFESKDGTKAGRLVSASRRG